MTDTLFNRNVGVEVGDVFLDVAIAESGVPDPMAMVKVADVDEAGMIHLVSVWNGAGSRLIVSRKVLGEKYRKDA